jgi:tRNA threonylcarbamoyladenosine biosynthesis protein TsaE
MTLHSLDDTRQLAARLAGLVKPGDALLLSGDLGSGKTTFAQYFIRQLAAGDVEVTSPTFALVQPYDVLVAGKPCRLLHYDLYRIDHSSALTELGMEENHEAISIIEWPERIDNWIDFPSWLHLHFTLQGQGARAVKLHGGGAVGKALQAAA